MNDRIARIAFYAACLILAVGYGILSVRWNWFPNPQIALAERTVNDLRANWKNDVGLEPSRHLVDSRRPRTEDASETYRVHREGAAEPGFTLISGLSQDQDLAAHAATLYSESGDVVHVWPVDYELILPGGLRGVNVMLHGVEPLPDGSLVTAFDAGSALARIDACGQPMWVTEGDFHHSVELGDDGTIWSWRNEVIVQVDVETGEVLHELDLRQDIIEAHNQHGAFSIHAAEDAKEVRPQGDAFHANDVEPLREAMADAFPMFEPGDLLISLRELNLVAVIDPEDGALKWAQHGPWHRQHDPDFEPDGTISVYDNQMGIGASRILKVDPASREVTVVYEGTEEDPFYSYRRGKHQILANGNVLITESEMGRVFEAAADGGLVWERELDWDADRNLIITSADRLPIDFFEEGAIGACGATVDAEGLSARG